MARFASTSSCCCSCSSLRISCFNINGAVDDCLIELLILILLLGSSDPENVRHFLAFCGESKGFHPSCLSTVFFRSCSTCDCALSRCFFSSSISISSCLIFLSLSIMRTSEEEARSGVLSSASSLATSV
uniref:Uncharacterized protein n=1 Tax=Arundo donax TaxID=35708 RepID=A0A0A9ESW0_ARUDO